MRDYADSRVIADQVAPTKRSYAIVGREKEQRDVLVKRLDRPVLLTPLFSIYTSSLQIYNVAPDRTVYLQMAG